MMKDLKEILESREGILKKHIEEDKAWTSDPVNGRFFEGRIVIEQHWLEETRKLIEFINKHGE